jgi:hypothetical protein
MAMDDSIHEMYYLRLPSGAPTQGDIWGALPAEVGSESNCTGIVITPRCDLAHDKTPAINYLPVISLNEYLRRIGGFDLVEQEMNAVRNRLRQAAAALHVAEVLDVGLPPREIVDLIDQGKLDTSISNTRQRQKQIDEFRTCSERLREVSELLKKDTLSESDLTSLPTRELRRCRLALVRNTSSDSFFLPPCPRLLVAPSVVLLRYIYTCRIEVLTKSLGSLAGC